MSVRKLTNSTDETFVSNLFSNDSVFDIPFFQRAYKWSDKKIHRFLADLENLLEYEDTSHFLGAIIIFGRQVNPSDPKRFEVIDGQQRLTTCYLALMAMAKTMINHGLEDKAFNDIYLRCLITWRTTTCFTNAKLICSKDDRSGMNRIFDDLMQSSAFKTLVVDRRTDYNRMPATGDPNGRLWKNYSLLQKYFEKKFKEKEKDAEGSGAEALNVLLNKLLGNMSVVQIVVTDPTDGPKIFDSLNSKQEPMTVGDLIRNEIFSKYSNRDAAEIDVLDRDHWRPFYEKFKQKGNSAFDKVFEQYFFPYVLTLDHNVTKADAFNYLRDRWSHIEDPREIIKELSRQQDVFLDLHYGTELYACGDGLKKAIHRLSRMEMPTSVYPFVMHVVSAVSDHTLSEAVAVDIIARIESFLVRRAVCGYEPTGLHAAFKSIWSECDGVYTAENVVRKIKGHSTVKWPDKDEFAHNIKVRPLYKVKVTPYLLAEWNGYLGGDVPELDSQQIEHVLPETPDNDSRWFSDWTRDEHSKCKDCIANLLPISASLNSSIQNDDYSSKRLRYRADSALKAPRDFAEKHEVWTPTEFSKRADVLASWAVQRWCY